MKKLLSLFVIGLMMASAAYANAGCGTCASDAKHEEGTEATTEEGTEATAATDAQPAGDTAAPAAPAKK